MSRFARLSWGAVLALALSAGFVVSTALVNRLPAALAVSAAVVPAALALALLAHRVPLRAAPTRDERLLAIAVGAGVWLAPFMVAASRRTDAPSGTEVLFLTTAVWGLLLVVAGLLPSRVPPALARAVSALLGVTGAMAILGNWERPSSFSPFIRFRTEELVIVLAGVVWVATVKGLAGLVRKHGPLGALRAIAVPAAVTGVLGAVVLAPTHLAELMRPDVISSGVFAAVATFALLLSWAESLRQTEPRILAAAYFLPPVLLTGLTLVERLTSAFGPDPIVWPAASAGMAIASVATALVAVDVGAGEGGAAASLAARGAAVVSVALAVVGLVTTCLVVSVHGSLSSGPAFAATFGMLGYETVGGWLAACCSILGVAWAWSPRMSGSRTAVVLAALLIAAAAWLPVHSTPTHAWTTWIPAEVQQDYGTEYASRTVADITGPWQPAAIAAALVAVALSSSKRRANAGTAPAGQEVSKA